MDKNLKQGVKILGLACASFDRTKDKKVDLYGSVVRGATILEGVIKTTITVDGEDATERILRMVTESPHFKQLKMIMARGITIAGFNYIDIKLINEKTGFPVVAIIDHKPDMKDIKEAIKNVPNWEERYNTISKTENLRQIRTNPAEAPVFVQSIGWPERKIDAFLKKITVVGRIPEPIRITRLIATAQYY